MKFLRRLLTVLVLLAVLAFAAAPFAVPLLLEDKIRREFSRATGSELNIGWALFNPFGLSVTVRDLEVKNARDERLLLIRSARFDFDWPDVWSGSGAVDSDALKASWNTSGEETLITFDQMLLADFQGILKVDDFTVMSGSASGSARLVTGGTLVVEGSLQIQDLILQGPTAVPSVQVPYVRIRNAVYDKNLHQISIDFLALHGPQLDIVRKVAAEAEPPAPERRADTVPLNLLIRETRLENGEVTFTDIKRSSEPVVFTAFSGSISNLTTGNNFGAAFNLTASIAGESPLEAAGQFDQRDALNGTARLRLDKLSYRYLTPYMFHLLGRAADAGTAYMDMDIAVADDMLEGTLSLVFDQWKWGAKNPDFDADPAPVRKAFNLLEGKGGRVRMTIPVEGNLAEPTFKLDAVVRRATRKAIGGIVGAPFKLLGSLIPGGKSDLDLDKIEFAPGSADLTPLDRSKLDALAAAMTLRPQLKLRIDGVAVATVDQPETESGEQSAADGGDGLMDLANRRALAVRNLLVAAGVDEGRLSIVIVPLADTEKRKKQVVRLEISE